MKNDVRTFWWINLAVIVLVALSWIFRNDIGGFYFFGIFSLGGILYLWMSSCLLLYKAFIQFKDQYVILPICLLPVMISFISSIFTALYATMILIAIFQLITSFKILKR